MSHLATPSPLRSTHEENMFFKYKTDKHSVGGGTFFCFDWLDLKVGMSNDSAPNDVFFFFLSPRLLISHRQDKRKVAVLK